MTPMSDIPPPWPLAEGLLNGEWTWPEPDAGHVLLLLDGVPELARHLNDWSGGQYHGNPLYAGTPFAAVQHLSPWLVQLAGPHDSILQRFLADGLAAEWGYLLVSQADPLAVADHLRALLQVRMPDDTPMLLRVADPAVIGAMLPAERSVVEAPWGPIAQLIVPDSVMNQWRAWHPAANPGHLPGLTIPPDGHRLNDTDVRHLQACDRRTDLRQLARFVAEHCPGWLGDANPHARLEALTREVAPLGLTSSTQWQRLCRLMARLRQTSLTAATFPGDIREILTDRQRGDGTARLRAALAHLEANETPATAMQEATTRPGATDPLGWDDIPPGHAQEAKSLLDDWL
ncbi:hypothetical protein L861_04805, partial [Litchfieldella anticariensis FP35 = DSM 16096]